MPHVGTGALRDYCSPACVQLLTLCPRTQESHAYFFPFINMLTVLSCVAVHQREMRSNSRGTRWGLCVRRYLLMWPSVDYESQVDIGRGVGQMTMDNPPRLRKKEPMGPGPKWKRSEENRNMKMEMKSNVKSRDTFDWGYLEYSEKKREEAEDSVGSRTPETAGRIQ